MLTVTTCNNNKRSPAIASPSGVLGRVLDGAAAIALSLLLVLDPLACSWYELLVHFATRGEDAKGAGSSQARK